MGSTERRRDDTKPWAPKQGAPIRDRTPVRAVRRYIGHCAATGKAQYVRKRDAKAAKRETPGSLYVFRCEVCGYFEVGSRGGRPREDHRQWNRKKYSDQP